MFDLTFGEIKKTLRLTLVDVDDGQAPPVTVPINLTTATEIKLQYGFVSLFQPLGAIQEKIMSIIDPANGIVQYIFLSGDLTKPSGFGSTGKVEFVVKVTFSDGRIHYSGDIGILTIKDKVA